MMCKKLFVFAAEPFHEKLFVDLEMRFLIANGIEIHYVDLSELVLKEQNVSKFECQAVPNTKISNFIEFRFFIRKNINASSKVIWDVPLRVTAYLCLVILSRFTKEISYIKIGCAPNFSYISVLKKIKISLKAIIISCLLKARIIEKFSVTFFCGDEALKISPQSHSYVSVAHYDLNMEDRSFEPIVNKNKYAVFLDNALTAHPDIKALSRYQIDKASYFKQLNLLFSIIEKKYGVEMIVAGHPKVDYCSNDFEGRRVFKGQTKSLVAGAEFLLSHNTTSISFAALSQKKILFLTSDEILSKLHGLNIPQVIMDNARFFKTTPLNIDHFSTQEIVDCFDLFDLDRCTKFKEDYLCSSKGAVSVGRAVTNWVLQDE